MTLLIVGGSDSPWTAPTSWDSITIGGVQYGTIVPNVGGKVRVLGAARRYRLDTKDPQGADGSTTTYRGLSARQPFTIRFYVWTQAQYDYFEGSMIPALVYTGSKNTLNPAGIQSLAVDHPALRNRQITSILIEDIGAMDPQGDGPNMYTCDVRVKEYIPPPPTNVTATPSGTKSTNQPTSPGKQPNPAIQSALDANNARRARLQAAGKTPAL